MTRILFMISAGVFAFSACDSGGPEDQIAVTTSPLAAGKVNVCHKAGPHGKVVSIKVGAAAVDAHLAHGDHHANADGTCDEACEEGATQCSGTGFVTCSDGELVYRPCAPGTECRVSGDGILCDWPTALE